MITPNNVYVRIVHCLVGLAASTIVFIVGVVVALSVLTPWTARVAKAADDLLASVMDGFASILSRLGAAYK